MSNINQGDLMKQHISIKGKLNKEHLKEQSFLKHSPAEERAAQKKEYFDSLSQSADVILNGD